MLSHTFWFVPAIISLCGPLLACVLLALDRNLGMQLQAVDLFYGGVSAGSTLLSTIAGSLITVAGLAFSVTIVALQLVSSQYTPRALRGFLQDRVTQIIAGGFFAIFSYALLVLANVREATTASLLPRLSITVAIVLGFFGPAAALHSSYRTHHPGRRYHRAYRGADIARAQAAEQRGYTYAAASSDQRTASNSAGTRGMRAYLRLSFWLCGACRSRSPRHHYHAATPSPAPTHLPRRFRLAADVDR